MRFLVPLVALAGCSPWYGVDCTPTEWRSEVWVNDARTGQIEVMLREGCNGFPDTETEYRVLGRRPGGSYALLLEGGLEHFDRRHAVIPLADGTSAVAIWDMICSPAGDHFTCSREALRFD